MTCLTHAGRSRLASLLCCAAALAAPLAASSGASAAEPPRPFQDDIAQRMLACTGCHGPEGRAAADGFYPRIAGKPAGYLFNQLVNFRDGRRSYPPMAHLLQHLTDDYLREIAGYFAALSLPWPTLPPQPPSVDDAHGRTLVQHGDPARDIPSCTSCHGERLTGVAPAIPGLLGLPRDYLNAQFGAWRIQQRRARDPDCMAEISHRLQPADVAAITGWLSRQPMPADPTPQATASAPPPLPCGGVTP